MRKTIRRILLMILVALMFLAGIYLTVRTNLEIDIQYIPRVTVNTILAVILMAVSISVAIIMLVHSRRREKELAAELDSLEKEKKLQDELIWQQQQLVHHQKLETIGKMTSGIAHEFNNLLSPIMADSLLILEKSRNADEDISQSAGEIYEASRQAKFLVARICKLSRRQEGSSLRPLRPQKLMNDVLAMSASSIPGNITVKKDYRSEKLILGDEINLGHMMLNLIINAVQAMSPKGGTLTVSIETEDEKVFISLSDTGPGIPPDKLEDIFEPFFTTKEEGRGTGLGLPIAQRTATNHGGTILAENRPEGGAKFTYVMPAYDMAEDQYAKKIVRLS